MAKAQYFRSDFDLALDNLKEILQDGTKKQIEERNFNERFGLMGKQRSFSRKTLRWTKTKINDSASIFRRTGIHFAR